MIQFILEFYKLFGEIIWSEARVLYFIRTVKKDLKFNPRSLLYRIRTISIWSDRLTRVYSSAKSYFARRG